jgi:hypothetical protein
MGNRRKRKRQQSGRTLLTKENPGTHVKEFLLAENRGMDQRLRSNLRHMSTLEIT